MKLCVLYYNNKINLFKHNDNLRRNANSIVKHMNKRIKKEYIFVLAGLFFVNDVVKASVDFGSLDKAGRTILEIVRRLGFWACMIGCFIDVVKAILSNATKSVGQIMMKYGLAYLTFFFFPWMLELISQIFK